MAFLPSPFAILIAIVCLAEVVPAKPSNPSDTLALPDRIRNTPPPLPIMAKTVLTPTDEERQLGNLADLLEQMAGIHVMRTGELGDYLGVSMRGSSEQQVNLYVNGVLKNPATDPSLFLSSWDLSRVEKVEVYKGLAPDDLPGSPMGGAINIVTREGASGNRLQLALGAGSFGSMRTNGSADAQKAGIKLHLQVAHDRSEGDFTYYDDNGTEFHTGRFPNGAPRLGTDDLTKKYRRNNGHTFSELDGAIVLTPNAFSEVGIQADFTRLHKEIPTPFANMDPATFISAERGSDQFAVRSHGRWTLPRFEFGMDFSASRQIDDFIDTVGAGGSVGVGDNNEINEYDHGLTNMTLRATVTDRLMVTALASYGIAGYYLTDNIKNRDYPGLIRYSGDGKLTPTYSFGKHSLQAMMAASLYRQENGSHAVFGYGNTRLPVTHEELHPSLRLGYQYRWQEGYWASAQVGNSYRIPTFMEQFGDRGSVLANPNLRSEAGMNASLEIHVERKTASVDVQGFVSEGHRIITLVENSQFVLLYKNSGATRIFGIETRAFYIPRTWTKTELDLTLQEAQNLEGGAKVDDFKLIPYRPLSQASLRQVFFVGRWTGSAYTYYQGLAYPNPSNRPSLFDSYSHNSEWRSRSDLMVSYRISHLLVAGCIRNLFDARLFDFFNFPLAGRSYSATVQTHF